MLPGAASSDPQSDVLVCETGPWKTGARLWGQWKSNDPINGDFSSVILTRASTNHLIWKSRIRVNGWLPGQQQCMMASQVWINQSKTNPRTVTEIYYAHGTNLLPAQIITVILTLSLLRCYCLPSNMLCWVEETGTFCLLCARHCAPYLCHLNLMEPCEINIIPNFTREKRRFK